MDKITAGMLTQHRSAGYRQDQGFRAPQAKQLDDHQSRGLAEARIAARMRHPSVATVHDVIRHGDSDWLVMDYHRGGTLADLLDRRRRLPEQIVAALGLQLVAALSAVHAAGAASACRAVAPGRLCFATRRYRLYRWRARQRSAA
jgi:eukaryotic-like serine/threonine-protein kinase